jgi:hypothetical protein
MAMLSARFQNEAAARRAAETFIHAMGAQPDLVVISPEGGRPAPKDDGPTDRIEPRAVPAIDSVRVSIYDTAIDNSAAREALEAAGGFDIKPVQ